MIDPEVRRILDERRIEYCLIGATALAVHGVARYTIDVELLILDPAVLDAAVWAGLAPRPRSARATSPTRSAGSSASPANDRST